ncbi:polyhydroxyalkanoate depolymerase [soil metagenome]
MMYHAYQTQVDLMAPLRALARAGVPPMLDPLVPWWGQDAVARFSASLATFNLAEVTHVRPAWKIDSVLVDGRELPVIEQAVATTPFATLMHFHKEVRKPQPKVLLVAPMSGHFATLLRDTVRTMLVDHDVYITDWHNVRDVPIDAGSFGMDEYTQHLIEFLAVIGEGAHLVAICQPCVASLSAVALMSEDGHAATPASLTLMAGPIDCRISPTEVNKLAASKPIEWFEQNLISTVPWRLPGGGRRVYPGFVQLSAFMNMNKERHLNAFKDYYAQLVAGEIDKANATRAFYEEYFAVADLSADFYLETVKHVFQDYDLPQGRLRFRDRLIDPSAIRKTALLTVEGERDDICAVGQTLAAQDLCGKLRTYMKSHYVQAGVGHYGVFSGRRWQNQIYPVVREAIHVAQ